MTGLRHYLEAQARDVRAFLAWFRDNQTGFVGKRMPIVVPFIVPENAGAVDSVLFVPDVQYELVYAAESHITAGTDGSAVTGDVTKAASGTAITAGTSLLVTTFNLKSTASTPVIKRLGNGGLAARPTRYVNSGQQVGLNFGGTLTGYVGGAFTLVLVPTVRANW